MKLIGLIVALTFAWIASGLWAAGNWNAALRAEFSHLYQDPKQANSTEQIVWSLIGGPLAAASTLLYYGVAPNWTLTSKPFPCTETTSYERKIWCKED